MSLSALGLGVVKAGIPPGGGGGRSVGSFSVLSEEVLERLGEGGTDSEGTPGGGGGTSSSGGGGGGGWEGGGGWNEGAAAQVPSAFQAPYAAAAAAA